MAKKPDMLLKRHRLDKFLHRLGIIVVAVCCLFLTFFISSIIYQAIPAFSEYVIKVKLDQELQNEEQAKAFLQEFTGPKFSYSKFFSENALISLVDNNKYPQTLELSTSTTLDQYLKGNKTNIFNDQDKLFIKYLEDKELLAKKFNWNFFFHTESRDAELAGIATCFIGSIYTVFICFIVAFPIAICSAIYLEEFAPKNLLTSLIEVNINNLAAVPSIVFGLLGLAVLINFFDLPRSTPIVAGMTLAMMVLPIMIISTRQAMSTIPITIKHAALALGMTKIQVIIHHVLPLALPGIMTGVILSIARAIGETAPLILIGMIAFIVDIPHSVYDPATVMPVQIFLWTQNPEVSFHAKTAAAILILLLILIVFNIIAVMIRKKYENRW